METETKLTDKIRAALRISSKAESITEEINDVIAACKEDLKQSGVININEDDALIVRAVTLYSKAEFGYNDKAEKFKASYDSLKLSLTLAGDYNTEGGV